MATPARKLVEVYTESDLRKLKQLLPLITDGNVEPAGQGLGGNPADGLVHLDFSKAVVTGLPGLTLPTQFGVVLDNNGPVSVLSLGTNQIVVGGAGGVGSLPIVFNPGAAGMLINGAAGGIGSLALSNGQLPIGSTGVSPVAASLTAGSGISITPGPGSISIANAAPGAPATISKSAWAAPLGFTSVLNVPAVTVTVLLYKVFIPFNMTVNTMVINVTTAVAATHIGCGLYTYAAADASATLLGQFTFSSAATGIITGTPTAFNIVPGFYWYAVTADNATVAAEGVTIAQTQTGTLLNSAGQRITATGGTASAAGVLPATTGVIGSSTVGMTSMVSCLFIG